jgi:hypothetical protein
MMEAARTSETSVDNHSTRQYNPEDSSEQKEPFICPYKYLKVKVFETICPNSTTLDLSPWGKNRGYEYMRTWWQDKIFWRRRMKLTLQRMSHDEEFHNLYLSPRIITAVNEWGWDRRGVYTHGSHEKRIQNFSLITRRKEITWENM